MPIVLRIKIGSRSSEKAGSSWTIMRVVGEGRADDLVVGDEVKEEGIEIWSK